MESKTISEEEFRALGKNYVDTLTVFKNGDVGAQMDEEKVLYTYKTWNKELKEYEGMTFPLRIQQCGHVWVPVPQTEENTNARWKQCVFCFRGFDVDDDVLEEDHKKVTIKDIEEYLTKVWGWKPKIEEETVKPPTPEGFDEVYGKKFEMR